MADDPWYVYSDVPQRISVSPRLSISSLTTASPRSPPPMRTADATLAAIIGITGPVEALTDAQIAHPIPKIRCAAATLGARIPTTG